MESPGFVCVCTYVCLCIEGGRFQYLNQLINFRELCYASYVTRVATRTSNFYFLHY
jgi:hypothetical protein